MQPRNYPYPLAPPSLEATNLSVASLSCRLAGSEPAWAMSGSVPTSRLVLHYLQQLRPLCLRLISIACYSNFRLGTGVRCRCQSHEMASAGAEDCLGAEWSGYGHQASPDRRPSCRLRHHHRHSRYRTQPIQMGWRAPCAVVAAVAVVKEDALRLAGVGLSCLWSRWHCRGSRRRPPTD